MTPNLQHSSPASAFAYPSWRSWRLGGLLFLLPALLAVDAFASEAPDSADVAPDTSAARHRPQQVSPRGAALRSLALPGWGQFYNRRPVKGVLLTSAYAASLTGIVIRQRELNQEPADHPRRNTFIFAAIGVLFYSAVDAYVDANFAEDTAQVALGLSGNSALTLQLILPIGKGSRP